MNNLAPNESDKDPIVLKDRVFSSIHGFKEWIENTQLFQVLKQESNNPNNFGVPVIRSEVISLNLNNNIKVNSATDLPIEMIEEFFRNSPYYCDKTNYDNFKLLENGNERI